MTQKYKKNNSPTIQNGIFSCFPDVLQPNLSGFPDVSQPDLSDFPDVFFGLGMGQHVWRFKKNMGDLQVRSPIRVMWKTLVVFGDRN